MCLEEIGLRAKKCANHHKFNTQHDWGNLHNHSMSTRVFTLVKNESFLPTPKISGKWSHTLFGFAKHLTLIVCSISYDMLLFQLAHFS